MGRIRGSFHHWGSRSLFPLQTPPADKAQRGPDNRDQTLPPPPFKHLGVHSPFLHRCQPRETYYEPPGQSDLWPIAGHCSSAPVLHCSTAPVLHCSSAPLSGAVISLRPLHHGNLPSWGMRMGVLVGGKPAPPICFPALSPWLLRNAQTHMAIYLPEDSRRFRTLQSTQTWQGGLRHTSRRNDSLEPFRKAFGLLVFYPGRQIRHRV